MTQDEQILETIAGLLSAELMNPGRLKINIGPYTAFVLISTIQLACLHPAVHDSQREQLRSIVNGLRQAYDPATQQLIDRGWETGGLNISTEAIGLDAALISGDPPRHTPN